MNAADYAALFVTGADCTVNRSGDIYMTYEARPFIGADCEIVKRTKGGKIMVRLKSNPLQQFSFAQRNVDLK